jgi:hypothetical protein
MAAKLLFLYLLAVTGLAVVQASTSTSQPLIRPVSWFIDSIHQIAPLILDRHHHSGNTGVTVPGTNGTLATKPDSAFPPGSLTSGP